MAKGRISKRSVDATRPGEKDGYLWDSELTGFGLKVTPAGRKLFLVQYRLGGRAGRTRRVSIGAYSEHLTPEQARNQAKKLLGLVAAGIDPAEDRDARRDAWTVREAAAAFLDQHVDAKLRASSALEYRRCVENHLLPATGSRLVSDINASDIARLHRSLASTRYQANHVLAVTSKLFAWCVQQGIRKRQDGNPCAGIERYPEEARERLLSAEELSRLGKALGKAEADGTATPWAVAAIRLLLLTGARRSEILTLKWAYIDAEGGVARLADSKTGAKNLYLPAPALKVLAELPRVEGNPFVIVGRRDGAGLVNLAKPWGRIRKMAGLQDLRLHDMRHAFASAAAVGGMSLPLIGALLGHSQPATTAKYAHYASDPLLAAAGKVAATFAASLDAAEDDGGDVIEFPKTGA